MSNVQTQTIDLEPLPSSVAAITGPLTSDQLEKAERLTRMRDDSWVLHEVIQAWQAENNSERGLRRIYATAMLIALCVETIFANTMFVLLGASVLVVPTWVANVFFVTVFGQIAAGALAITKYLFPPVKSSSLIPDLLRLRQNKTSGN